MALKNVHAQKGVLSLVERIESGDELGVMVSDRRFGCTFSPRLHMQGAPSFFEELEVSDSDQESVDQDQDY